MSPSPPASASLPRPPHPQTPRREAPTISNYSVERIPFTHPTRVRRGRPRTRGPAHAPAFVSPSASCQTAHEMGGWTERGRRAFSVHPRGLVPRRLRRVRPLQDAEEQVPRRRLVAPVHGPQCSLRARPGGWVEGRVQERDSGSAVATKHSRIILLRGVYSARGVHTQVGRCVRWRSACGDRGLGGPTLGVPF